MADLLSEAEIVERLPDGWTLDGEEIVRTYEFDDYLDGAEFVADVAGIADDEFHHPEVTLRFREVEVRLTSHEAGGVTVQDVGMAGEFDDSFAEY
jgi:4a-hydroxytetrahydrobiopterin dehydratase